MIGLLLEFPFGGLVQKVTAINFASLVLKLIFGLNELLNNQLILLLMKVKQIQINHPQLGQIVINSSVEKEINELIGTITDDYAKYPKYYHANIFKNEDGTFKIENLNIITPQSVNVGMMKTQGGCKSFVTLITNKTASEDIVIYPAGVISVEYNKD